jgi:DNA-binding GntR family transcriptional regulator
MKKANAPDLFPSAASRIAEQIRDAIIDGRFHLGEALSEETLAAAFEVSRTPIHEALTFLKLQGLVTVVPRAATFVFQLSEADIAQLCEYRLTLELRAATLALERKRALARASLTVAVTAMKGALNRNDGNDYGRADTAFHETFFTHCGNHYLDTAHRMSLGRVAALRTYLNVATPGAMGQSFSEHQEIVRIFRTGSPIDLERVLTAHILRAQEAYMSAFRGTLTERIESKAERIKRKISRDRRN